MVDGEREAARLGLRGSFGHFMYVNGADDLFRLGRWDEAAERLEEAARMELSRTARALRRATAAQLHVARGELEAARARTARSPTTTSRPSSSPRSRRPAPRSRSPRAIPPRRAEHVAGALGGVEDPFYTSPLYSLGLRAEAELAEHERARRRTPDPSRARALLAALDALVDDGRLARLARPPRAGPRRVLPDRGRAVTRALARGRRGVRRARRAVSRPPSRGSARRRRR